MKINLYQSFYNKDQIPHLDIDCIAFDNTKNEEPNLREYPLFKKIYEIESSSQHHWGLISPRFEEKTLLKPKEFKTWIEQNPGFDVYYIDPFLDVSVSHQNLWTQGDIWHPGLYKYFERLVDILGKSAKDIVYHPDDFITCNFFVGNKYFWNGYFNFVDFVIVLSKTDSVLHHYMFEHKITYNGGELTYFSFIVERLLSLYFYFNSYLNKKKFPIEHECFQKKYGANHTNLISAYKSRV